MMPDKEFLFRLNDGDYQTVMVAILLYNKGHVPVPSDGNLAGKALAEICQSWMKSMDYLAKETDDHGT